MAKAQTIHEVLVHLKDATAAHLDGRPDVAQALLDEVEEALHGEHPDCECREERLDGDTHGR
jgi:hypothetical protein